jgi:hypothetical protein
MDSTGHFAGELLPGPDNVESRKEISTSSTAGGRLRKLRVESLACPFETTTPKWSN